LTEHAGQARSIYLLLATLRGGSRTRRLPLKCCHPHPLDSSNAFCVFFLLHPVVILDRHRLSCLERVICHVSLALRSVIQCTMVPSAREKTAK